MAVTGSQKLAVLLCRFSDSADTVPQNLAFMQDLFARRGTGGLNDYWIAASLGSIDLDGTQVFDWMTITETRAEFVANFPGRDQKVQRAVDAFGVNRADFAGIVAVYNVDPGDAGASGGVLAGPGSLSVTFLAHETGHVFGLDHSFDQSSRQVIWWSAPGEYYDRHDIMSAMNVDAAPHARFGNVGPLLSTPYLDLMGWLPPSRVWRPQSINSSFMQSFDLVSLGHPEIPGYVAAVIGDRYVEFRTMDRWDAGIGRAAILIHRMSGVNAVVQASNRDAFVNDWQPGQTYGPSAVVMAMAGGTQISVVSFDLQGKKARIDVRMQARRPSESVTVLGDIAVGDGWIVLRDVLYRIPPKGGPLRELLEPVVRLPAASTLDPEALELASAITAVRNSAARVVRDVGKLLFD